MKKGMRLASLCVLLFLCVPALCGGPRRVSVVINNGAMQMLEGWHQEAIVNASFDNRINETG